MMPMPSSLPIPVLGLTLVELVNVIHTCGDIRAEEVGLVGLRKTIAARLRLTHPLLSLKVSQLDREQLDALGDYLKGTREPPG
jgi:hypothetical protein